MFDDTPKMADERDMMKAVAKAPPIGEEVTMAIGKLLAEQDDLLDRVTGRLSPILNYRNEKAGADRDTPSGMYSPMINLLMEYSDKIATSNRRLRELMEAMEI